jgi:small subunit ribosomal protein S6
MSQEELFMRLYESVFIARQDISATQVESMADEFAGIITSAGGSIKKREYWGLRSLAYRIKKNRKGHYIMFNMETDSEALKEYERIMLLNEDVLRFLNIRIEEVDEAPSIMMQAKTERAPRSDRGGHRDDDSHKDRDRDRDRDKDRDRGAAKDRSDSPASQSSED